MYTPLSNQLPTGMHKSLRVSVVNQLRNTKLRSGEFSVGRNFLIKANYNSDLIEFLTSFAKNNGIALASFNAIGALKKAKLGFYDQETHKYEALQFAEPLEIASRIGNISAKDGEPFVHAHAVLAYRNGNTKGGHLLSGKVFAAEVHLTEFVGPTLKREKDGVTGLFLWTNNI
jgi:predicted DNA-binding protein with PD1-like motif